MFTRLDHQHVSASCLGGMDVWMDEKPSDVTGGYVQHSVWIWVMWERGYTGILRDICIFVR